MKKIIFIIVLSVLWQTGFSQAVVDTSYQLPVKEKLHYKIYYKLGGIWINAGLANFNTDTLTIDSLKTYKFTADGYSLKKYAWVYSLEDHYKSIVDYRTLMPVRFEKENTEKGVWVHNIYNFYPREKKIDLFMEATDEKPIHKTMNHDGFITDALSAIYYIRILDFDQYQKGDTISFKSILDGKVFDQQVVYMGKDEIKTRAGEKVTAFKLNAVIENSTFFRGDDAVVFWITDNDERWLAKVKAKIVVGSIIVCLDKQGLISFDEED